MLDPRVATMAHVTGVDEVIVPMEKLSTIEL